MELIEVDPLESQPPQTVRTSAAEMLRPAIDIPVAGTRARQPALARYHELGRIRVEGLSDQCLAHPRPIGIGGVDKSHTAIGYAAEQGDRFPLVGWRSPNAPSGDAHRAKADAADRRTVSEC